MENWKEAWWLAKFEIKKSKKGLFSWVLFLVFTVAFFVISIPEYFEKNFVLIDIFFPIMLIFGAYGGRPKEFQVQQIDEDLWASKLFMMLNQLPIKKTVLIKSRFIITYFYAIPFYLLFFTFLYLFSQELQNEISLASYFVFSFLWICVGIHLGSAFPAADAGEKTNMLKSIVITGVLMIACISFFTGFALLFEQGFVGWTMMIATEWSLLTILVSIIIAYSGIFFCKRYMEKRMKRIDYVK